MSINTIIGKQISIYLYAKKCVCAKSLQSCLAFCEPMGCSLPGSCVHGILQARILEWAAVPSSRGSSRPRGRIASLTSPMLAGGFFTTSSAWEDDHIYGSRIVSVRLPFCWFFFRCAAAFWSDIDPLVYFCFCWLCFWCHTQKSLPRPMSWNFSPMFSPSSPIVSGPTFVFNPFWVHCIWWKIRV